MEMEYEKDPGWQYLRLDREKLMAEQSKPFNGKTACWMPDKEEGYLMSEIKSTKGDIVTIMTSKGTEVTLCVLSFSVSISQCMTG